MIYTANFDTSAISPPGGRGRREGEGEGGWGREGGGEIARVAKF